MKKTLSILLVILILLIWGGCSRKNNTKASIPNKIEIYTIRKGNIKKAIMESGTVEPKSVIKVMSKIGGKIAKILVKEGEKVKENQVIAYVYPDINEIQRINQIKKNFKIATLNYQTIAKKYESYKKMLKNNYISQTDFDEVKKNYINAKMSFENSKIEMEYISDVQEKTYNGNIVYTICAPTSGTFYGQNVEEGEFIRAANNSYSNGTVLGYIGDLSHLEVIIPLDEVDRLNIRNGMPARISFDALPNIIVNGKVSFISLNAKDQGGFNVFTVKVDILNGNDKIKPGLSANVNLIIMERKNVLKIIKSAVHWDKGQPYVELINGEKKYIKIAKGDDNFFEVKSGLKEGDKIKYVKTSFNRFRFGGFR